MLPALLHALHGGPPADLGCRQFIAAGDFLSLSRYYGNAGPALINQRDVLRQSALMYAAKCNNAQAVDLLVERKANLDFTDALGTTALIMAAQRGHADICHRLLKAGAHKFLKGQEEKTAADWAFETGHEALVGPLGGLSVRSAVSLNLPLNMLLAFRNIILRSWLTTSRELR